MTTYERKLDRLVSTECRCAVCNEAFGLSDNFVTYTDKYDDVHLRHSECALPIDDD